MFKLLTAIFIGSSMFLIKLASSACDPFEIGTNFRTAQRAMVYGFFNPNDCLCNPCTRDKVGQFLDFMYIKKGDESYSHINTGNLKSCEIHNFKGHVKFLLHGYTEKAKVGWMMPTGRQLAKTFDGYVILVDHDQISSCAYGKSVREVNHAMAEYIADLIRNLNLDPRKVELIGHSMGAHLAGSIGVIFHGAIERIIGLDPARPMYDQMNIGLNRTNAQFVQVLHTDPGEIGTSLIRGDADFFPNRRSPMQPGCNRRPCGHAKAIYYYYASLFPQNKFVGKDCRTQNAKDSKETNVFGEYHDGTSGVFCFRTSACFPYTIDDN